MKREHALSEFIDAWTAGRRPDVDAYVARVAAEDRAALADEIAAYLTWAPDPDYDNATLDAIAAEPIVRAVAEASAHPGGLWPALLPRLRRRAALSTADVASGLTETLALAPGSQAKTERYLGELEAGTLPAAGLSRRLRDGLAQVLAVPPGLLAGAADTLRPTTPATALFRADDVAAETIAADLELLADALAAPPTDAWDEVDALFRGGG